MKRFFLASTTVVILTAGYLALRESSAPITTAGNDSKSPITVQFKLTGGRMTPRKSIPDNQMSDDPASGENLEATLLELAFLPEEKRVVVARIVRDAEIQEQEIVNLSQGFRTATDEERIQAQPTPGSKVCR